MRLAFSALLLPALLAAQAEAPASPLARDWGKLQEWAGGKEAPAEFQVAKLEDFLKARRADNRAAKTPAWKPWLEGLAAAKSTHLQAWARTRLVEAGVFSPYEALLDSAVEHLKQLSLPGPKRSVVRQPPSASGWMPGTFRIHADSPFWVEVERQTRSRPDLAVNSNLYAIWCHGHFPAQRSLIFDIAAKVEAKATVKSPKADAWNDPRLWIVADWAMAWGSAEDFQTLEQTLPDGPARTAFARLRLGLKDNAAFWAKPASRDELQRRNSLLAKGGARPDAGDAEDSPLAVAKEGPDFGYPPAAQDRGLQTILHVAATVDPEGRVVGWRPSPGPWLGLFTPWAAPSVIQWRFEPARKDSVPLWARTSLNLEFRSKDRISVPSQMGGRRASPSLTEH